MIYKVEFEEVTSNPSYQYIKFIYTPTISIEQHPNLVIVTAQEHIKWLFGWISTSETPILNENLELINVPTPRLDIESFRFVHYRLFTDYPPNRIFFDLVDEYNRVVFEKVFWVNTIIPKWFLVWLAHQAIEPAFVEFLIPLIF